MTHAVAKIAVDAAVPEIYSYLIPLSLAGSVKTGQLVLVPFGRRQTVGYVMELCPGNDSGLKLKPIISILRQEALFGSSLARLVKFISAYYFYPPGLCAKEILPGGLAPKIEKAIVLTDKGFEENFFLGDAAELKNRLAASHPAAIPLKTLEKEGFTAAVQKMIDNGGAKAVYLSERGTRPAYEWWLGPSSSPPASPKRLGSKEKQLWELAKSGPAKPMSYYASYINNPLPQARSLTAKGLTELCQKEIFRDDPERSLFVPDKAAPPPTPEQATALEEITTAIESKKYQGFMLFGVTGSGKTEVYLRAAAKTLSMGREVLWLTPEIALTLGLEGLLKTRLGPEKLAVLHSALTPGQRHDQWLRIRRGLAPVTLGARSAVFAPLENIGLVIVDEEHDWAYKQDDGLRYNGRDLAIWRAADAGAVIILGSATPSMESFQKTKEGRLKLLEMKNRPGEAMLPEVEFFDQRQEPSRLRKAISPPLMRKLEDTLARGEQALLFINRRGMANLPMCLACGEALKCPHCSRTLTLHGAADNSASSDQEHDNHLASQVLVCHCCGYRADPPRTCPQCASPLFRYFGIGTEKLLQMMEKIPNACGGRLDADSSRQRGGMKKIISDFAEGNLNVLIGTQMAAKGHDFPNLTLVGVIDADLGLNLPDFRASERTYQLISQVAGRAGRSHNPGTVLIQTMNPHHYALTAAAAHDYETFFANEIEIRAQLGYPPFARLALLRLAGPDEELVCRLAEEAGNLGRELIEYMKATGEMELLGPAPSPIAKLKDRFRYQIMVRAEKVSDRAAFLNKWLPTLRSRMPRQIRITVDIDPYQLL